MLSRVADSIYWMSRYIERAENVARFVDVEYPLPAALSSGPRTLVVRFAAAPDSEVPAVFGIRLVR